MIQLIKNNTPDPKPDEPREPQWKPPGPDTIPQPINNPSQFPEQDPNEVPVMDPNEIPGQKNLYYEGV